ncbi:non-ribosomal peptide synthase/polyketide synthase [Pseudomonas citronellolis]|uniref:non-ribosomal peptide synthase/polyketide synthase n=1 Tax=Pseudomonas citronellolis TaxID=53408 RepID=UPI0021135FD3|nr:non-ribosomal peptide synthase/polyketide synthase [Pseudomonas citronellolis]UUC47540.1 non-ribosomal peptide synthase/polyketide synthase [Pseudomonas citronellolis]
MDMNVALRIARRFITLPLDKRKAYLQKMLEEGVSPANLPIPEVASAFDSLPLSYAQERQWFLWQMEPDSPAYNIPSALRLRGELDLEALRAALAGVVSRHQALRTLFVEDEEQDHARQLILAESSVDLPVSEVGVGDVAMAIAAFVENETRQPFDLRKGPLLRARLLRLAADDHVLTLTLHHAAADGWSMGVLVEELIALYAAHRQGGTANLADLPIQYADYAIWQRHWLEAGERERQLAYWQARLGGVQPVLELPCDRPRPPRQSYRGARSAVQLPAELSEALKALARREDVTLFMLLLASFQALLQRYSGQRDIRVGVPVANRNRVETERLIGFFVNTQVLRAEVDPQRSFRELLQQVRRVAVEAQAHQDLPFEQLVEALQPERSLGHSPLFQVMYNHQGVAGHGARLADLPGLVVEQLSWEAPGAPFDLSLETYETAQGIRAEFTYALDLFDAASVERLGRHWSNLLQALVRDPQQRLGELPMLDADERQALLLQCNPAPVGFPAELGVHQLFERQAALTPHEPALLFGEARLSYAELNARANRLAHLLRERGVGAEQLVGIALERGVAMVVSLLAVLKAGGAYVPLDPRYPADRLRYMVQDSGLALLLTQQQVLEQLALEQPCAALLLDDLDALLQDRADGDLAPVAGAQNLAYVIYTSGSTGKPKGVMVRHAALANFVASMARQPGVAAGDRLLSLTTFSFDIFGLELYVPLARGACVVLAASDAAQDPEALLDLVQRHAVNVMQATPATWRMLLDSERAPLLHGCRLLCGGEALPEELAQRLLQQAPELWNLYGPTETTIWSAQYRVPAQGRPYLGAPIDNTGLYILDEFLEPCAPGVAGELLIGGEGLARGYFQRPALTAERFVASPFGLGERLYRTGDLARYRADGVIEYLGRIDHQVKIRGFRIELGEIEAHLLQQDAVHAAVVVAQPGPGGAQLVAYLVPAAGHKADALPALREQLRQALLAGLPDYMVPAQWVFLAELPLTPNGKVDRKALPQPEAVLAQAAFSAPLGELEETLAAIWSELLGVQRIGREDHFFDLGGHSLLVAQVVSRVRRRLGVQAPLRLLFEQPTLAGFAAALGGLAPQAEARIPRRSGEAAALSFAQERQWFLWQLEPDNPAYNIPLALRLRGELDVAALQAALDDLLLRHESLRSTFDEVGGEPRQLIHPRLALAIEQRKLAPGTDEAALRALVEAEAHRPFDLRNGPLLRVLLLESQAEDRVLVLTLQHIVADGWSLQVLVEELLQAYAARSAGQAPRFAELPIQYADYAAWQRQWLAAGEGERQLTYWCERLGGEQPLLELPGDRPRPSQRSQRGRRLRIALPAGLEQALGQLAQAEGSTLFMLLLASFQALLHRYSGQADIRVGVPIANRNRLETEGLIGFFVNTQVLRAEVDPQTSFRSLLGQVRQAVVEAQGHQDLPFEQLVDALQPERSLGHAPLFQVLYNHQREHHSGARSVGPAGLRIEDMVWEVRTAKFDLTLDTCETAQGLSAELTYACDLFDAASAERIGAHWVNLLQAMVAHPEARIGELELLDAAERGAVLRAWNPDLRGFPVEECLHQRIARQAALRPQAVAVTLQDQALSYGELNARANRLAHRLIEAGVGPDVLVGLAVERSLEMVVGLLAILKAGGAYVPLDPRYPQDRLAYMIEDSAIGLLLTQAEVQGQLPAAPGVQTLLLEGGADWLAGYPESDPANRATVDNLAYVIYTSGSTGKPKGTLLPHRNVLRLFEATNHWFGFGEDDAWTLFHSYAFDFSVWEIFGALLYGGKLVIVPHEISRSPEDFLALLCRERVTVLNQTPSAFKQLQQVACDPAREVDLALRHVVFGGEALEVTALRPWFERFGDQAPRLINMYGITETTVHVTYRPITLADLEGGAASPIGEPIPDLSWYLLDAQLEPVAPGCIGELYVGGAGLARGYLNRADLSSTRFVADPFSGEGGRLYRTGDLARFRRDGVIEYIGRIDHQVKIRGFRIELGEIEARLLEQPQVREVAVLPHEGPGGTQLVAYIVPKEEGDDLREQLRGALKAKLPEHMVPTHLLFLGSLPLTANGKLDRRALPAPDASQAQQAYVAPRSELEKRLAAIWAQVLKLERVGLEDNFFELGGDSIISIQVVSRARQAGIHLSPKDLFLHQTVGGLASVAVQGAAQAIEQGPVRGATPLLPIQQQFFAEAIPQRQHWNQSVLLRALQPLRADALAQALRAVLQHHDALRLSFHEEQGNWRAEHQGLEAADGELLWQARAADADALLALAEAAQRSLDLAQGPLLRALLVELDDGSQRLLLAIHHLVVDGVSWRVLFEDLQGAYRQAKAGQAIVLPAKTSAFKHWAERLQAHAASGALEAERGYWLEQLRGLDLALPGANPEGAQSLQHARSVRTRLDAEATRRLLQEAPAAYRTQVNDLLLTALARVICRWTGQPETAVLLEGHGREALFDDIDLSRTVGWFTSVFPLRLSPAGEPGEALKRVKEQLRAVPNKGLGFGVLRYLSKEADRAALAALPQPNITFNYLGQFDGSFATEQDAFFVPSGESPGAERDPRAPMGAGLTLNGQVYAGALAIDWSFSGECFAEADIQALANAYADELQALVAHCCSAQGQGVTPSDFPLAGLAQAELDSLPLAPGQIEDLYPLSPMQQGMLFHSLYQQDSGDYINQLRLDVEGLDPERFRQAWQAALDSHAILRTGFLWHQAQPLQVVRKRVELPFSLLDWRGRADLGTALDALAGGEARLGFDLAEAPLLRLLAVRTGERRYHLIYTNHHILMDGWSNSQLLGEVLQRYRGLEVARGSGRYRDYIAWLQEQDAARSEAFWKPQLAALEEPTRLAAVLAPEVAAQPGYADHALELDERWTQRLNTFAREQKVTLNTLVQAAWLLLLQRYTGQATVAFGATVSGRPAQLRGIEQQIGLFINTLPVIASPRAEQSLAQWLQQVQALNLELREQQHTPLYDIQRWAGQGGEALFDNILVFENYPVAEALNEEAPADLRVEALSNHEQTHYPLTVLVNQGERLELRCSYARAAFDERAVATIAGHWLQLLQAMVEAPQRCLGELPMLAEAERDAVLRAWNPDLRGFPVEECLHQGIARQAALRPQAVAVTLQGRALSYGELNARANRLAHRLIEAGVGPDVLVGLAVERSLEMVVGLLAILKAGGAYVPLDPRYPQDRLAYMIEDSAIGLLLTQAEVQGQLPAAPGVQTLLLEGGADWLAGYPESDPANRATVDNLAYVIYTSGSTGKPKGTLLPHRNVLRLFEATNHWFGFGEDDAWTLFHSYAFDFSVWEIFGALLYGGKLVIVPHEISRSPEDFLALLCRERVTVLNQTPSAFKQLQQVACDPAREIDLALRHVVFGGEALEVTALRPWFERFGDQAPRLINMYGITETTVHVTYRPITLADLEGGAASPIGEPIPDLSWYLLDAQLEPVAPGCIGELYVGGAGLARGYLNRADLSSTRFVADPFSGEGGRLYRTGDLARFRRDGVIEYIGRIDHQVKIRGFRIELGEIEARLLEQPQVREVAVLPHEGPGGTQLVAYIVPKEEGDDLREQLRGALKAKLPEHMVPTHLLFLGSLPLTANGKLDRRALPAPDASQAQQAYVAPRSELELALAAIWQEVLQLQQVGLEDNFFELGGHSLLATQVLSRLRQLLDAPLGLRDLFEHPCLGDLAAHIAGLAGQGAATAVPQLRSHGAKTRAPLSLVQRRLWITEQLSGGSSAYGMPMALRLLGPLAVEHLRRSFELVAQRHEVLRTAYSQDEEGNPLALIAARASLDIPLEDLSALAPAERDVRVNEAFRALSTTPIDLEQAPLVRARLLRLGADEHVLLHSMHHIISDGWSLGVLINDLVQSYSRLQRGESGELPALPLQYSDFSLWQEQLQAAGILEQQAGYWRERLAGYSGQLPLPLDRPRAPSASQAGGQLGFELPAALVARLREVAQRHGVTLYSLLLGSFQLFLHRLCGSDDVVVGVDVAGRGHTDLEALIGFFVNVLPLRSRLRDELPLGGYLRQIQQDLLAALEHQDLPFDMIVESVAVPRFKGMNPLLQVLFVMNNLPARRAAIDGLEVEALAAVEVHSKFDMALFVEEEQGRLQGNWQFASELFQRDSIQRFLGAWTALLEQFATDQDRKLGAISMPIDVPSTGVSTPTAKGPKADKLGKFLKRAGTASAGGVVQPAGMRETPLVPGQRFPLLMEPSDSQLDLIEWTRHNRPLLEQKLAEHAGILFRGFRLDGIQGFEAFAEAVQPGLYGQYGDLPKKEGGRNTYRSTPYPERKMILFHNESSHQDRWPRKQLFYCEQPSLKGGATPVVDCRLMYQRLPQELRQRFEAKGLLYVRTFADKLDVPWQHFFKTEDRAEVERRCRESGIQWQWLGADELQIRTPGPAIIRHPVTGEASFFNQVQLHHIHCLDPDVREDLLAMYGLERMPRNVYYGDGTPIEDAVMELLGELYEACAVRFDWQKGDVILLDNMLAAHARDPYEGPRKIVVAMGDMYEQKDLRERTVAASAADTLEAQA